MKLLKKTHCLRDRLSLDVLIELNAEGNPPSDLQISQAAWRFWKKYRGRKYKKVFICWYLPGMILDSGAYATSHFDPDLKVEILGVENGVMEEQGA